MMTYKAFFQSNEDELRRAEWPTGWGDAGIIMNVGDRVESKCGQHIRYIISRTFGETINGKRHTYSQPITFSLSITYSLGKWNEVPK